MKISKRFHDFYKLHEKGNVVRGICQTHLLKLHLPENRNFKKRGLFSTQFVER